MEALKIHIDKSIYDDVLSYLKALPQDKVRIISEDKQFKASRQYLSNELNEIDSGNGKFVDLVELEAQLEKIISNYEDNN